MSNNRLFSDDLTQPAEHRSTRASVVADDLRAKIITGVLAPNVQLRAQVLADAYQMTLSPVREALNRLVSEGLVRAQDMRGFFVAPVSETELADLTRARCWINEMALRQSILAGDAQWEEHVLLAYHRLSRLGRVDEAGKARPEWDEAHRVFHRSLTQGCGSDILVNFCDQLFVQAERYRNLSRRSPQASAGQRDDDHLAIMKATLARDAETAASLLNQHFKATAELSGRVLRMADGFDDTFQKDGHSK